MGYMLLYTSKKIPPKPSATKEPGETVYKRAHSKGDSVERTITIKRTRRMAALAGILLLLTGFFTEAARPADSKPPKKGKIVATYQTKENIFYLDTPEELADQNQQQRCRLDVYYPEKLQDIPVIIWLHGGGLSGGDKYIPLRLQNQGFIVVGATYRFSPSVKCQTCIEDAAAAVAWVFQHIGEFGGDPKKIFLSGHSAGGYLTAMLGMDPRWLAKHNIKNTDLAGIAPLSGMMSTHFQVRAERGDTEKRPVIDELAPLWYAGPNVPPLLLITGDREMDWPGRMEENQLLARTMKIVEHKDTTMYEMQGYGHDMQEPGFPLLLRWVKHHLDPAPATPAP